MATVTATAPGMRSVSDHQPLAGHIGLLVPPANPSAEPEVTHLLTPAAAVHTTRFPVLDRPLAERLAAYNAAVGDMIASFGPLAPQLGAVVMACSGSRYPLGPDRDQEDCARWTSARGMPVATATLATRQALQWLKATNLVLISPYEPPLTEHARTFWERAGLTVRVITVQAADGSYAPYRLQPADLVAQIERARLPSDAVVLCTGTGMPTLGVLPLIGAGNDRVLLTSNVAAAWWALRHLGRQAGPIPERSLAWPLRRLAAQGLTP
ncbi:maleate cis-trans isomerase family protein [Nonomuraea sp. KM90]|uniref:maleate cis-trans isomerase family protein n=1 Tax=Nonomuraea sp. KM90 TaxID=3457428 RepID=UPI003FCD3BF9